MLSTFLLSLLQTQVVDLARPDRFAWLNDSTAQPLPALHDSNNEPVTKCTLAQLKSTCVTAGTLLVVQVLGYYIGLLKTMSLKLDGSTVQFFFHQDGERGTFPLYTEAVKLINHRCRPAVCRQLQSTHWSANCWAFD